MAPRMLRKTLAVLGVFVFSVLVLDQFGIFLILGQTYSADPGYEFPMTGDMLNDLLPPVDHIYDSLDYRIHNSSACGTDLRLVIFVKSALPHRSRRNVIRSTWGWRRFSDIKMASFFLVGRGSGETELISENEAHHDIIQADFFDNYYNNTLKTMSAVRWAIQHCSRAQYVVFIDDDYYLSVKNLLRYIDAFEAESGGPLFAGTLFENVSPMRHRFSKWFVTLSDYPFSRYPNYITAGMMLLNQEALHKIYAASKFTKYFQFDDIFIGICARKARIELKNSDFIRAAPRLDNMEDLIAAHGFDEIELERVWKNAYNNRYA